MRVIPLPGAGVPFALSGVEEPAPAKAGGRPNGTGRCPLPPNKSKQSLNPTNHSSDTPKAHARVTHPRGPLFLSPSPSMASSRKRGINGREGVRKPHPPYAVIPTEVGIHPSETLTPHPTTHPSPAHRCSPPPTPLASSQGYCPFT